MDRFKATKLASLLGIIGNLFLLIIKGIIAIISNSQSLLADAFNSAGDILSSLMTYIGNRISSKKADDDHNLGHGKAEYIYSLLISITMLLLSTSVIKSAINTLIHNTKVNYSVWLVIVCIVTIITKLCLFIYTNYLYKKTSNILIKANRTDHRNDMLVTTLTLISIILGSQGVKYIDSIVGILISLWIMLSAIELFRESYNVLMDKSIDNETKDEVLNLIKEHKEVKKVQHFNSTPIGYKYQISFTIFVDGNLTTFESHKIANHLEKEIGEKFKEIYLTVIHVNPYGKPNKIAKKK